MIPDVLRVTDEELRRIAERRTRSPQEIQKDVEALKIWWNKQPHLPKINDEDRVVYLLQTYKFSIETVKRKVENYFTAPHLYPMFFKIRDPTHPHIVACQKFMMHIPLPQLTENLERVSIIKWTGTDLDFPVNAVYQYMMMFGDLIVKFNICLGGQTIYDLQHVSPSILAHFSISDLKQLIELLQKCHPGSLGGIHILNAPSYAVTLINFIKTLIRQKFESRIHIHENVEQLHEYISKKILPSDFGGNEKSLQELQEDWTNFMVSKKDVLMNMETRQTKEELRIGPPLDNELFGAQGTFREMNID